MVQKLLAENGEQRIAYFAAAKKKMRGAAKILKDKANYFYGVDNPESDCTAIEGRLHARRNVLVADGRALLGFMYRIYNALSRIFSMWIACCGVFRVWAI